jgi:hypothetical protein
LTLFIAPAAAGLMVTVPVPVGDITTLAFAGDNATVACEDPKSAICSVAA